MAWLSPGPSAAEAPRRSLVVGALASVLVHGLALGAAAFVGRRVVERRPGPAAVEVVFRVARMGAPRPPASTTKVAIRSRPSRPVVLEKQVPPRPRPVAPTPEHVPAEATPEAAALDGAPEAAPDHGTPHPEGSFVAGGEGGQAGQGLGPEDVGEDSAPALLEAPAPPYPPKARVAGLEGRVRAKLLISAQGTVSEVALVLSSGTDSLDRAALEALKAWRFLPARRDGRAVPAWVIVPVRFSLKA